MALDPRMSLAVKTPDVSRIFSNALTNIGALDTIRENRELAPLRRQALEQAGEHSGLQNELLQAQTEGVNLSNVSARDKQRLASVVEGANELLPFLQNRDFLGAVNSLEQRKLRLQQQGLPTQDTDEAIQLVDRNPELLMQRTQQAVDLGQPLPKSSTIPNIKTKPL